MNLPKLFQATTIATLLNSSCSMPFTVPISQTLEPRHTNCIKVYLETRQRILDIMDERDLSFNDLINFYGVYPDDISNLRQIHPQAYEAHDICSVITSPIYYNIYRILERYPDGRYPDGTPPEN